MVRSIVESAIPLIPHTSLIRLF